MVAPGAALDDVMGAIDVAVGAVRTDMPTTEPAGAGAAGSSAKQAAPEPSPCAKIDAQFGGRWEADPNDTGARLGQTPAPDADEEEGEE